MDKENTIKNIKITFKWLPHIFFYLIIGIMIGLNDVVRGEFGVSRFFDPSFYSDLFILYGAAVLTLLTTIDIYVEKYIQTEPRVKELQSGIKYMLDKKIEGDFPVFMTEYNMKRKEKEYIHHVNELIENLDETLGVKDNNKWIYYKGTKAQKAENKYCIKRAELEEMKSKKEIERVVKFTNFKFDRIPETFVKTGAKQKKKTIHGITVESKGRKLFRDLSPRLILGLTWTILVSSFVWDLVEFDARTLFTVATKMILIVWNFITAIKYATYDYGPDKILVDLQMRRDIMCEYITWKGEEQCLNTTQPKNYPQPSST